MLGLGLVWPLAVLALRSVAGEDGGLTADRYAEVATSSRYLRALGVTAAVAGGSTALTLLACVPAALYLERDRSRLSRVLAVALTVPLSLPGIVIGFFVVLTLGNTGVVPKAIELLTGERALQLAYTGPGLLLGYAYFSVPRVVLVVRGAAAAVSTDAVEAARTLGASTAAVYRWVVLPALRPAIASAAALSLATAFGAYGTAAVLARSARVLPLEIAAAFTESFEPERAAALSIALAAITTLLLAGVSRLGETTGRRR